MTISIASYFQPRNATNPNPALRNTYYLLEDIYLKGGFQVRADIADRDSINSLNLKQGMLVLTVADGTLWKLDDVGNKVWTKLSLGGSSSASRTVTTYTTSVLPTNGVEDFVLPLGNSVMLLDMTLDQPVTVEAHDSPLRTNTNPYKFIATTGHLSDDGSTLMSDGTIVNNRRYALLANNESPKTGNIYFRITNSSAIATAVKLSLTYLPIEL